MNEPSGIADGTGASRQGSDARTTTAILLVGFYFAMRLLPGFQPHILLLVLGLALERLAGLGRGSQLRPSLGLTLGKPGRTLVISAAAVFANLAFFYAWFAVLFRHPGTPTQCDFPALGAIVGACIFALHEELFFRGYVISRLKLWCRPAAAIGISAVVFGLAHFPDPGRMLTNVVAGIIFGVAFQFSGSLIPCVLAHGLANALAGYLLTHALVSG